MLSIFCVLCDDTHYIDADTVPLSSACMGQEKAGSCRELGNGDTAVCYYTIFRQKM